MVILRKPKFLKFFAFFFQISDIISDVIIKIVQILEFFFGHFVYNITKYNCTNYHYQHISIRIYTGGTMCPPPPPPRSTGRKKKPVVGRVNYNHITLNRRHIGKPKCNTIQNITSHCSGF